MGMTEASIRCDIPGLSPLFFYSSCPGRVDKKKEEKKGRGRDHHGGEKKKKKKKKKACELLCREQTKEDLSCLA
jgi:hypothetical protein